MFIERKSTIRVLVGLVIALAVLLASEPSFAEKRIALVIGNGAYPNLGVLKNPPNDAKLMARTLRSLGFDVIERIDADQKGMKKAIKAFGNKLEAGGKDAVGLFYYAGHGVQVGGANYMIPVNVDIQDEADVDIEAVSATAVQGNMAFAGNRLNIIVMDACRNNPFKRSFRSASRGLAKMDASKGTLIAYATSPGDVAADGKGDNSPYTAALAKAMLTPGLTVERMFKEVRNQVVTATNSNQVPWEASSLTGADFYFNGGGTTLQAPTAAAPATQAAPAIDKEAMFWQSVQNSENVDLYEAYLSQYPTGTFAILAKVKIAELKKNIQTASLTSAKPEQRFRNCSDCRVLNRIKERGQINIGHRESSVPFAYIGPKGKPIGYSIDLCMKIVDSVKQNLDIPYLKIKFVPVTSQTRIALMVNGTIDLECGSTYNLAPRRKHVAFLATTFVAGTRLASKKGSGITEIEDMNDKAIALVLNTTDEKAVRRI